MTDWKILHVSWTEHRRNQSIAEELMEHCTLLKSKSSYFSHVKRHKMLQKLILERKLEGQTEEDQRDLGRRMWRTGWGQVSGEWDEQTKISWEKDVEDWMGASVWRVGRTNKDILGEGCGGLDGGKCLESGTSKQRYIGRRMWRTGWGQVSGEWDEQPNISWEKDVEDWMGTSVWRVGRTNKDILGEGCGGLDGDKCLESGTNKQRYLGRRMWRTGWGQVSGEWDEQTKISWGEGCGGLDGGKCLESGTNKQRYLGRRMWRTGWGQVSGEWDEQTKIYWEKNVEDWMGASVWRVGRTAKYILGEGCGGLDGGKCLESGTNKQRYLGRRMWRTGWGQVSGEWDEQTKISWEKDVEDWMGASVWRVGRTNKDILGEGCGGLDGGKCLESGTNKQRDLGRRMWRTGWGQVSGEWDEQTKISWEKDVEDWMGASVWRVGRTNKDILGEGCGGLDGGKCLESGTNKQRYLGRRMWRTGWGQVSG